uniref:DNA binding protein n=1 Tax=Rhizophora mucronata TaxID=61149 RepID=A0A2P2KBE3_RHIMU
MVLLGSFFFLSSFLPAHVLDEFHVLLTLSDLIVTGKRLGHLLGLRQSFRYAAMHKSTFKRFRRMEQVNIYLPLGPKGKLLTPILRKPQKMPQHYHNLQDPFSHHLVILNLVML